VPIGLCAVAAARFIPESRAPQRPALDWTGAILVSVALVLLLVPMIEGPAQDWPVWSWWSLGTALALLALFHRQQERRRAVGRLPLVDMQLLAQPRFALGTLLVLLIYSTSSSFFLCFALLVQTGLGIDPFTAGSIFAPCSVGFVLASLSAPYLVSRWGSRAIVAGALLYAISIGLLIAQVQMASASIVPTRLIPVLMVVGAGQGLIMTPLLNLVLGFVDEAKAGMASGVISTVQQIGAALGVAVVGILFRAGLAAADETTTQESQYASAFIAGMIYNLIAALLACVLLSLLARTQPSTGRG